MNVDARIRPWLLAIGKAYGLTDAYHLMYPDESTRPTVIYAEYKELDILPTENGTDNLTTAASHTVTHRDCQKHTIRIQVDLYNSQDGMYELAAFGVAAQACPQIKPIFLGYCSYKRMERAVNLSTRDGDRFYYHHRAVYQFEENVEYTLVESNGDVTQIDLTLESGGGTYNITRSGY